MISLIIYKVMSSPYIRLVRVCDGKVWDSAADALAFAPTWGDTDIALTKNAYIGGYPVTIPANLPAGDYDLLLYDAVTPANTDIVQLGKRISWTEKDLLGLPVEL